MGGDAVDLKMTVGVKSDQIWFDLGASLAAELPMMDF